MLTFPSIPVLLCHLCQLYSVLELLFLAALCHLEGEDCHMQGWHQPNHDLQGFQWPHLGEGTPCKRINLGPGGLGSKHLQISHIPTPCPVSMGFRSLVSSVSMVSFHQCLVTLACCPSSPRCGVPSTSGIAVPAGFHAQGMLHFVAIWGRRENWGSC